MRRLKYTEPALADLDAIFDYTIKNWGQTQAEWYIETLRKSCEDIASGHSVPRPFPALGKTAGMYHCERHYIFFHTAPEFISIFGVLHENMNLISRLKHRL